MSFEGGLFNIAPHRAFVDALARGILARVPDTVARARTLVLLPNRRAVRALTQAFVRQLGAGEASGLLLPRMVPVGDLGEDDFERLAGEVAVGGAVSPLVRRLQLARLVRALPVAADARAERSAIEALRLGDALGDTLDVLLAEEVPPAALREAVAEADLAHHWADTLKFLDVIISAWPPVRDAMGASDGGTRLAAAINAVLARWADSPPATPVIAAGIGSAAPAVARLLGGVLNLPAGAVVLPGLDVDMSDAGHARFEAIHVDAEDAPDSEAHPQYALKLLLARLGRSRADVTDWGHGSPQDGPAARDALVMAALAPADAGEGWLDTAPDPEALAGIHVVEALTGAEEAQAIALAMRRALETKGRTAALVTPDRALAQRVAAHCRRWGISVDDSAGQPLPLTPPGAFAGSLVAAMAGKFSPVRLLALLKHPLVRAGEDRLAWLGRVRQLDVALRGVRPTPGLDGVSAHLDAWLAERRRGPAFDGLAGWWEDTAARLAPLEALGEVVDLAALAEALRSVGEALCGDALWSGIDGRALAARLEALIAEGALFGPFEAAEAPPLLAALFADVAVRPGWGGHPRLAILGPVEAQLARADLMILGGLNEGVWPALPAPDPWLAPAIRTRLGLPGAARAMGLAAQDFVRALGAGEVLLTRARRDASGPMRASRLLVRLDALAARLNDSGLARDEALLAMARALDRPAEVRPAARPAPSPPRTARPAKLSVTQVDVLLADPFAFYAQAVLALRPLDELDEDPGAADRGTLIHEVLEDWVKGESFDPAELARLTEAMIERAGGGFPLLRALWGPRARRALTWAGDEILRRRAQRTEVVAAEIKGQIMLGGIEVRGVADRVDRRHDGRLVVTDYKTGARPRVADVTALRKNQLALLALMLERGGMTVKGLVDAMEYWQLTGSAETAGKWSAALGKTGPSPAEHLPLVASSVGDALATFLEGDRAFVSHVHPALAFGDYDQLARVLEWRDQPR
ncbi:MAG: double-strand break repair protein AddB [Polymorphobacter sp.]|uniref:double-strand break repair protein AddB n=1 Tax=Polymorphobacter sp. TaxID=1909290 RepID=UPI003A85DC78